MTRKDYNLIANILCGCSDYINEEYYRCIVKDIADGLHTDNPRFLYKRFYEACRVDLEAMKELE
jgi:hypothetical protein